MSRSRSSGGFNASIQSPPFPMPLVILLADPTRPHFTALCTNRSPPMARNGPKSPPITAEAEYQTGGKGRWWKRVADPQATVEVHSGDCSLWRLALRSCPPVPRAMSSPSGSISPSDKRTSPLFSRRCCRPPGPRPRSERAGATGYASERPPSGRDTHAQESGLLQPVRRKRVEMRIQAKSPNARRVPKLPLRHLETIFTKSRLIMASCTGCSPASVAQSTRSNSPASRWRAASGAG